MTAPTPPQWLVDASLVIERTEVGPARLRSNSEAAEIAWAFLLCRLDSPEIQAAVAAVVATTWRTVAGRTNAVLAAVRAALESDDQ